MTGPRVGWFVFRSAACFAEHIATSTSCSDCFPLRWEWDDLVIDLEGGHRSAHLIRMPHP